MKNELVLKALENVNAAIEKRVLAEAQSIIEMIAGEQRKIEASKKLICEFQDRLSKLSFDPLELIFE